MCVCVCVCVRMRYNLTFYNYIMAIIYLFADNVINTHTSLEKAIGI